MPNSSHNSQAALLLKLGLSIAFGYAAIGSFLQPDVWIGYLPESISHFSFAPILLMVFSSIELLLVVWLLSGWKTKYAALLAGLMLSGIVLTNIADLTIFFRDLALIFAAAALFIIS